jgi:hypothetical protein
MKYWVTVTMTEVEAKDEEEAINLVVDALQKQPYDWTLEDVESGYAT